MTLRLAGRHEHPVKVTEVYGWTGLLKITLDFRFETKFCRDFSACRTSAINHLFCMSPSSSGERGRGA